MGQILFGITLIKFFFFDGFFQAKPDGAVGIMYEDK